MGKKWAKQTEDLGEETYRTTYLPLLFQPEFLPICRCFRRDLAEFWFGTVQLNPDFKKVKIIKTSKSLHHEGWIDGKNFF